MRLGSHSATFKSVKANVIWLRLTKERFQIESLAVEPMRDLCPVGEEFYRLAQPSVQVCLVL